MFSWYTIIIVVYTSVMYLQNRKEYEKPINERGYSYISSAKLETWRVITDINARSVLTHLQRIDPFTALWARCLPP